MMCRRQLLYIYIHTWIEKFADSYKKIIWHNWLQPNYSHIFSTHITLNENPQFSQPYLICAWTTNSVFNQEQIQNTHERNTGIASIFNILHPAHNQWKFFSASNLFYPLRDEPKFLVSYYSFKEWPLLFSFTACLNKGLEKVKSSTNILTRDKILHQPRYT